MILCEFLGHPFSTELFHERDCPRHQLIPSLPTLRTQRCKQKQAPNSLTINAFKSVACYGKAAPVYKPGESGAYTASASHTNQPSFTAYEVV